MEFLTYLVYPAGIVLELAALIHYFRHRSGGCNSPDQYWFYIIVFLGPLGAAAYLGINAAPDAVVRFQIMKGVPRQKRVTHLEAAVEDNPSAANFEELGDLYMDSGDLARARAAFDRAIAARSDTTDTFYRRGLCALRLKDPAAAIPDLERVLREEPGYDFHRAAGLLAHACAKAGEKQRAEALFQQAICASTLSETYLNYADFLAAEGRHAEARQLAQKVLDKERTMPTYLRRRERPWFQSANEMLKRLPEQMSART